MRLFICFFLFLVTTTAFSQLSDKEIRDLKSGRTVDDTSYIYTLPYDKGSSYLLVQGSNTKMSHKGELAYDFKMKEGSRICAARNGIVIDLRKDSDDGGLKQENLSDGNYIVILHDDQSASYYWHLKKEGVLVNIGDTVSQGQVIGLSGNTGYSAFPHLHFQVTDPGGKQILVRFRTRKGSIYLKPGKWYKNEIE